MDFFFSGCYFCHSSASGGVCSMDQCFQSHSIFNIYFDGPDKLLAIQNVRAENLFGIHFFILCSQSHGQGASCYISFEPVVVGFYLSSIPCNIMESRCLVGENPFFPVVLPLWVFVCAASCGVNRTAGAIYLECSYRNWMVSSAEH